MAKVKDDRCGRPIHAVQESQDFDAEPLIGGGEGHSGDGPNEGLGVLPDMAAAARCLPTTEADEIGFANIAELLDSRSDHAVDDIVVRILVPIRKVPDPAGRNAQAELRQVVTTGDGVASRAEYG